MKTRPLLLALALPLAATPLGLAADSALQDAVTQKIAAEYPSLAAIYQDLHIHPELSFMEERTAGIVAKELRALGFAVTEKVGRHGVVAVLQNGAGPTVLVRTDMDALPIKELTGLPYASSVVMPDFTGKEQPAMHACGHDAHVTTLIGTARVLAALKDKWSGTAVLIGQPAEETGGGARAMLMDGLYTRFPRPDYVLAYHVGGDSPAGEVSYVEGASYANVDSIDILVRGVGGHGARPHSTRDPVVLASEIVLALQTIVSRELKPGTPAVITVGAIHGGTKRNIIPAEVKLELTLRCYDDDVANHMLASIRRICDHTARAAGVPENLLPVVTVTENRTPLTYNDPALTRRLAGVFREWFPAEDVKPGEPATYGEDFSEYGRTSPRVPISIFWIGGTDPKVLAEAKRTGQLSPSNHSAFWAPLPEPTIKTAVKAMSAAVLDLLAKK
ncbi:MAG: amidohydrolase [Opitutae bacterium]|nr:amidohydrolase [Opitutae bacterium]